MLVLLRFKILVPMELSFKMFLRNVRSFTETIRSQKHLIKQHASLATEILFLNELKNKVVITDVSLRLKDELQSKHFIRRDCQELLFNNIGVPSPKYFRCCHQHSIAKLPDPKQLGNAGSFFKNPIKAK